MTAPLPDGCVLVADRHARWSHDGRCFYGGTPWRLLHLTDSGAALARRLLDGEPVKGPKAARLARVLADSGLAHVCPPESAEVPEIDVVVPAFDRADALERCLDALSGLLAITVVDDGSRDERAVASVAARRGAATRRLPRNAGPAAARNAGLAATDAPVVAFVDSDSRVTTADLVRLSRHFADPTVGAVAPRIRGSAATRGPGRFATARSPLDQGADPAAVRPHGRVSYVPSTVLLVRRRALADIGGFDEALRYGEDVDLCWRLFDAGWLIRYEPTVAAAHDEPTTWWSWLQRSYRYGTSAGPLGRRHGSRISGPLLTGLLLPGTARRIEGLPPDVHRAVMIAAPVQTALGAIQWGVPLWWPLLVPAVLRDGRPRVAAITAMLAPGVIEWLRRRPALDPVRYVIGATGTDAAYGAGVWVGAVRSRTLAPLLPRRRKNSASDGGAGAHDDPRMQARP